MKKTKLFVPLIVIQRTGIVILSFVVTSLILVVIISPGETSPIVNADGNVFPNSIAVINKRMIGGIVQGMIIRGENVENPVLLYVHGGPGAPSFPVVKNELKKLEKLFTICYWEQRGACMSYTKNIPVASMTLNQMVEDAADVTRYLLKKFGKKKIFILGHSWGSLLSSFTIHKYPELFCGYIGVGQIANTYLSEQESYQFVITEAKNRNDKTARKELQQLRLPGIDASGKEWFDYFFIQRKYVFKYGGARYGRARDYNDLRKAVLFCREYTVHDKLKYASGVSFSQAYLDKYMMNIDLNAVLVNQQIPVYIFQGLHDQQTNYSIAKQYFNRLKAPIKKFYTFTYSAHSPHTEQYDIFEKIVKTDILYK